MGLTRTWKPLTFACAAVIGCSEPSTEPTATSRTVAVDHSLHGVVPSKSMVGAAIAPFTYRAPLGPLTVRESPDFEMKLNAAKEMTVQSVTFPPGPTIWHTHPATSFVLVVSGSVKLERFIPEKSGAFCVVTPVFNANQAFVEPRNRVHRAIVQGTENAELLIVRFNVPIGTPLTVPAADPGC